MKWLKTWTCPLALMLLTGCSGLSAPKLTSQGALVKIETGQPPETCQFIERIDNSRHRFISHPDQFDFEQDTLILLKNQAAEKGANTLFKVTRNNQNFATRFYPAPLVISADAYRCE